MQTPGRPLGSGIGHALPKSDAMAPEMRKATTEATFNFILAEGGVFILLRIWFMIEDF